MPRYSRHQTNQMPHVTAEPGHSTGSIGGLESSVATKTWDTLTGIGSIAFAFEFSAVLVEVQVSQCIFCGSMAHCTFRAYLPVHTLATMFPAAFACFTGLLIKSCSCSGVLLGLVIPQAEFTVL